jgi:predicted Zn-dependent protease
VVELQGSLGRLLRRIEAVGNDRRWFQTSQGFIGAPSLLIRHQPVVG